MKAQTKFIVGLAITSILKPACRLLVLSESDLSSSADETFIRRRSASAENSGETSERSLFLTQLEKEFYISKPTFNFSALNFNLDYLLGPFLEERDISYTLYGGRLCSHGSPKIPTNNSFLWSEQTWYNENQTVGNITFYQGSQVTLTINPNTIVDSAIFQNYDTYAHVTFCVRIEAHFNDTYSGAELLVNWVETPIMLVIDMVAGLVSEIQYATVPNFTLIDRLITTNHAFEVFLCDSYGNHTQDGVAQQLTYGTIVMICVQEVKNLTNEGVYISNIDSFYVQHDNMIDYIVANGNNSGNVNLASVTCSVGSTLCSFEVFIPNAFFNETGTVVVNGGGIGYLQFGTSTMRRKLQTGPTTGLVLQNTAVNFSFTFSVNQSGSFSFASSTLAFLFIALAIPMLFNVFL